MSCNIDIDLKLGIHDAALVREFLFRHTAQDSYEYPGKQAIIIRKVIRQIDEQIETALDKSDLIGPDEC